MIYCRLSIPLFSFTLLFGNGRNLSKERGGQIFKNILFYHVFKRRRQNKKSERKHPTANLLQNVSYWIGLKGTVKVKGNRLNPKNVMSWSQPMFLLLDVLVLRNWYKTVSKFKNSCIRNTADWATLPDTERPSVKILIM